MTRPDRHHPREHAYPTLSYPFLVDVSAKGTTSTAIAQACEAKGANVRVIDDKTVGLSFGESITKDDVVALVS